MPYMLSVMEVEDVHGHGAREGRAKSQTESVQSMF